MAIEIEIRELGSRPVRRFVWRRVRWCLSFVLGWTIALTIGARGVYGVRFPSEPPAAIVPASDAAIGVRERAGRTAFQQGDYLTAEREFQAAIVAYARDRQTAAVAGCEYQLSRVYDERGQHGRALEAVEQGLAHLEALATPPVGLLAQLHAQRGHLQRDRTQLEAAIADWETSLAFYERLDDARGQIAMRLELSVAYQQLGFFARSRQFLDAVRDVIETLEAEALGAETPAAYGNNDLRLWIWLRLADLARADGRYEKARLRFERGLELARSSGEVASEAMFLERLGAIARDMEAFADARDYYHRAAELAPESRQRLTAELGAIDSEIAGFDSQATDSQATDSQTPDSQTPDSQATDPQTTSSPSGETARTIEATLQTLGTRIAALPADRTAARLAASLAERVADWHRVRGRWAIAPSQLLTDLGNRLAVVQELGDGQSEIKLLGAAARISQRDDDRVRARRLLERALTLSDLSAASDVSAVFHHRLARLSLAERDEATALVEYRKAARDLDRLRQTYAPFETASRLSFPETIEPIYRETLALLLNDTATAADLHEGRDLLEALQFAELENYFRKRCLSSQSVNVGEIDPHAAIVYPIVLPDRLEVLLSLPDENDSIQRYSTRQTRDETQRAIRKARSAMSPSAGLVEYQQALHALYRVLLEPFEATLDRAGIETLVFVLDAPFRQIPMAALYDGQQYAIERYTIALAPSLQLLEPIDLDRQKFDVFIGALGSAQPGFNRLPGALREAEQIFRDIDRPGRARAQLRTEDDFTLDQLRNVLQYRSYATVHLATHGQFGATPEDTFVLTWNGKLDSLEFRDRLLRRDEMRDGSIELLVLSACQTASGDARATLGMAGFAVQSGVRTTIASLWMVNDDATAYQMVFLHEALAQPDIGKAEALRQAQLRTIALGGEYAKPFYWAPFVTIGYWL